MKIIKHLSLLVLTTILLASCGGPKSTLERVNQTLNANNKEQCAQKNGYWYNGKCWANFEEYDDGIAIADIDKVVDEQLALSEKFKITIDDKSYPLNFFLVEASEEDNVLMIINMYKEADGEKTLLQVVALDKAKKGEFITKAVLMDGNITEMEDISIQNIIENSKKKGEFKGTLINEEDSHFKFTGQIHNPETNKSQNIQFEISDAISGIGDTTLDIKGDKVYLNGILGTKGYAQFRDLIKNHPEVKTIVLQNVPGSINDAVNMHTGRIIREAGLNTMVEADSKISSGGVDLFCAGNERIVTQGAELGIHSWGGEGISADDIPKDHPAHQYQIEYFTMCLGKTIGPDFYFRTLSAAPAGEMYWMKDDEIKEKVATKFITK